MIAELVFEDEAASRALSVKMSEPDVAERLKADEEVFLDGARTRIVVVGEVVVTAGVVKEG